MISNGNSFSRGNEREMALWQRLQSPVERR